MVVCPNCGKEIPENSKFCQFCGEKNATHIPVSIDDKPIQDQTIEIKQPKGEKEKTKGKTWKWVAIATIIALVGGIGYLLYDRSVHVKEISELAGMNIELMNTNVDLMTENSELMEQVADLTEQKQQASQNKEDLYNKVMLDWVKAHGNDYIKDLSFYSNTSVVFVRKGETVPLTVTTLKSGTLYFSNSPGGGYFCEPVWLNDWENNNTKITLNITGKLVGTTIITLSRETNVAAFDVFVYVYE